MARVPACHFRNQDWHSDDFGLENPVIQQKKITEMCYLYCSTRRRSGGTKHRVFHLAAVYQLRFLLQYRTGRVNCGSAWFAL